MTVESGFRPAQEWVTVAVLGKTWGRRGELSAISLSGRPERYQELQAVFLSNPRELKGEPVPMEVEWVWEHRGQPVFKFVGVDSISDAEPFQGFEVRIPAEQRPELPQGEYYHSDLIGCEVIERQNGTRLGEVTDFIEHGGPGLLEVKGPEAELLIPFARSICVEIDVAGRRILVELPAGLKEAQAE